MRRAAGLCVAVAAIVAGCGSTKTVTVTRVVTTVKTVTTTRTITTSGPPGACRGSDLKARFSAIPGSAGAGQIGYELVLTNVSPLSCTVSGYPVAMLLDKDGGALPTQITAAASADAGKTVVLHAGAAAKADARFSPDVPGPGEQQSGQCESTAYVLRVAVAGGGDVPAPIDPPTPVCEHGALSFSPFVAA